MTLNKSIIQGRIPFDLEIRNAEDEKKAFMGFSVSVKRNWKPAGEQYYPEDMIYCKAFGPQAVFIKNYFDKGDNILLEGELRRDDDYEKDGNTIKGSMYFHVVPGGIHFQSGNKSEGGGSGGSSAAAPAKKTPPATNPMAKKPPLAKSTNPLAKKKSII